MRDCTQPGISASQNTLIVQHKQGNAKNHFLIQLLLQKNILKKRFLFFSSEKYFIQRKYKNIFLEQHIFYKKKFANTVKFLTFKKIYKKHYTQRNLNEERKFVQEL